MRRFVIITAGSVVAGISVFVAFAAVRASGDFFQMAIPLFDQNDRPGVVAGDFVDVEDALFIPQRLPVPHFIPMRKDTAYQMAVPTAHAAFLMDAVSEETLFENDADERRQIASITKLMTAMIVVERVKNLDETATISSTALSTEGTRVGCPRSGYCIGTRLQPGERISVRDLLRAALMNSANDAAIALSEHISVDESAFVAVMNRRASELGLENTRFCTASGLETDAFASECYSSARDVAKIASYALRYDVIWDIMQEHEAIITSVDGKYLHEIFNTDELLGQYPNLIGTKTGFTPNAGRSLLAVASDPSGSHPVIAVVLDDNYRWQSVKSMFDWAFSSFDWQ